METRAKVVIVQRVLPHYRKPFFLKLREKLALQGVELYLIYGQPGTTESLKRDTVHLQWGKSIRNRELKIGEYELCWQPCLSLLRNVDLVIVEQANKLLLNYVLIICQVVGLTRLCFWGHGRNYKSSRTDTIAEAIRKMISRHVHWWFAYNDLSADTVKSFGYSEQRITSVRNAVDSQGLICVAENTKQSELDVLKQKLGIKGRYPCLFIGSMYKEKRLGFLIDACKNIKYHLTDFEMLFIGKGEDERLPQSAAAQYDWIHYVGAVFGAEKVPYIMLSKLLLMPGALGLVVLDAFALCTPLVTTQDQHHGPEISYLENGVNGVIVENADNPAKYAEYIADLLTNEKKLTVLAEGCRKSRATYTLDDMVKNFAFGIEKALRM